MKIYIFLVSVQVSDDKFPAKKSAKSFGKYVMALDVSS